MYEKNIVLCDGGLSNRLNSLIFALVLREKFGHSWEISWPINNWCGSDFYKLFSINLNVNDHSLLHYKENQDDYVLVMHENQANFTENAIVYQSTISNYSEYEDLLGRGKPIFYYHHLLPNFAQVLDIKRATCDLIVSYEITKKATDFCNEHDINDSVLGLHIRKTDFGNTVDDEALYKLASESSQRFFVCSDDALVNERFSNLPNCCVYKKSSFPEKILTDSHWNALTKDDQGRAYNFNIMRSGQSIEEALIDLLILSKTTHVLTSHSTFLRISMLFKSINFFR